MPALIASRIPFLVDPWRWGRFFDKVLRGNQEFVPDFNGERVLVHPQRKEFSLELLVAETSHHKQDIGTQSLACRGESQAALVQPLFFFCRQLLRRGQM